MEDVGQTLKEIGEEYQQTPKISPDAVEMAQQLIVLGNAVVDSSHQHQKEIHNDGYKVVQKFTKQCPRLAQLEEARGSAKLEYDFFKRKVDTLKGTPQTDPSRLPRNEQRLESWRVELWKASESSRAAASELFLAGRNACDTGVYTVTTVLKSFFKTVHDAFSSEVRIVSAPSVFNDVLLPPLPLTPRGGSAHPVEAPARLEDPSPLRSTSTPSQPSAGYSVMGEGRPPLFSLSDDSPPYRGSASPYGGERPSIFSSYTDPNSKASTYQPPMV
ncbi:hypothetical protein ADEAN_000541100 [Angomonas deanei]|uniref:BAR domain containing protein n=1 Tax=Angomonas deanei TaxID=59799 RepID=A0A7G2CF13_9TRYP|nr:hypothetical protein ADEAN_000541100 [Angomonas deanei]